MKRHICTLTFLLFSLICLSPALHAQQNSGDSARSPYRINYWVDGSIALAGGIGNYLGIPPIIHKQQINVIEMQTLNRDIIKSFDKWALNLDPSRIYVNNRNGDIMLVLSVSTPALLTIDKSIKKDWTKILVLYLETISLTSDVYTLSFFGPAFQNKYRPVVYYDALSYDDRKDGSNRNSFYSGHVATAAAGTFLTAKVYCDYHPELGGKKYLIYAAAAIPPLILGYFRIGALRHFPSDVVAGLGVGALCGILIPEMHRIKFKNKDLSLGLAATNFSTGISLKWQPGSGR